MSDSNFGLDAARKARPAILELVLVAILLGLAVNMLAAELSHLLQPYTTARYIVSVCMVVTSLAWMIKRIAGPRRLRFQYNAALFMHKPDCEPAHISLYTFSTMFSQAWKALTIENPAFSKIWDAERERFFSVTPPDRSAHTTWPLANEISEYIVLHRLSTIISSSNARQNHKLKLVELDGKHLPEVVLGNRVLAFLSTPFNQRPMFANASLPPYVEVFSMIGSDGQRFERLHIELPKGGRVDRTPQGLVIKTPLISMTISTAFTGNSLAAPQLFPELYAAEHSTFTAKAPDQRPVHPYQVKINVDIEFAWHYFVSNYWNSHFWLDDFLKMSQHDFDFEGFTNKVGYSQAFTIWNMMNSPIEVIRRHRLDKSSTNDQPSKDSPTKFISIFRY